MDVKEMLQALINGQHALRTELFEKISQLEKKQDAGFAEVHKKFEKVDKRFDNVEKRFDTLGKQLAYLEDDAPTREEHDGLVKRVEKLEAN